MSSPTQNPFLNEWHECLLAHYAYVLARRDLKTEPTLRQILVTIGFPEQQLGEVRAAHLPEPEPLPQLAASETAPEPTASAAAPDADRTASETSEDPPSTPPTDITPPTPKKKPPKQLSFF
ncbi:MAG: hypothetical protein DYG88_13815 [Chloroflexi bacterium CFX4]|nr:hypothetical protein [Chloroflexi bacterium CFX4]MDL1923610.1 hypothetical protein [Chloroflexi bacterium CFX3]